MHEQLHPTSDLGPFSDLGLSTSLLAQLIEEHQRSRLPRLQRLWRYYRNALAEPTSNGGSHHAPAQRAGLPKRLTGALQLERDDRLNREIVIENDIAWRIHTLVDFMFPSRFRIVSRASDPRLARQIEAALDAAFDASGGIALWQDAALLGSVYGSVDFMLHTDGLADMSSTSTSTRAANAADRPGVVPSNPDTDESKALDRATRLGSSMLIETVEAPRAIPLLSPHDYRRLDALIIHHHEPTRQLERDTMFERLRRRLKPDHHPLQQRRTREIIEIISASHRQRYEDGELVEDQVNTLGRLPVVHVQNLSQPLVYDGMSDVEPLIPLQDELNTRLSDRANRVTMQSFRMWLGKGIDDFTDRPIGPGQMWVTDNMDASIESFGGDAASPSERDHIEELREALDKASGVTPAAAGHIRARVGNLTSENALRISLMGTVAKINRKRVTYGAGIEALCELMLHALDAHGLLATKPSDRRVDIVWADALPVDQTRRIDDALAKAELGVPRDALRAELGYPDAHSTNSH